jgi:hypothetical protein
MRKEDGKAYVQAQVTSYVTRCFVLSAAFQQFHRASRSKNQDLVYHWYVVGLAEHLALHRWDGKRLELGVVPLIAFHDPPAAALAAFDPSWTDLRRLTGARLKENAIAWAWVSFLLSGEDPRHRERFEKLALGSHGSMMNGDEFAATLGEPEGLVRSYLHWLDGVQIPWKVALGEWEDRDGESLVGRTPWGMATARLEPEVGRLRVEIDPDSSPGAGVALDWRGVEDNVLALIEEEELRVRVTEGGLWAVQQTIELEPRREHVIELTRAAKGCRLAVDGGESLWIETQGGAFGLVVESGTASFRGIEWEP